MAAMQNRSLLTTRSCCAKLLLKSFLTIFVFSQLQGNVNGAIYESVQWFAKNPKFVIGTNDQNCKEDEVLEMRVTVGSKLTFLCPTPVMVFETMQHDVSKESLYENLWIAYDKENFDTCTVSSTSKKLLACNNPDSLKYHSIYFNIYSASHRLEFPHEKYYYFLSTSDGTVSSINNTADGHCNDKQQKVAMKFRLFFCREKSSHPNCNNTDFPFGKLQCVRNKTATPAPTPSPSGLPTQTLPVVLPSTYSQPTTTVMATSPISQVCSTTTVVYTTAVQQAATVTINPSQCQCSTALTVINSTISFDSTIKEEGPKQSPQIGSEGMSEKTTLKISIGVLGCLCLALVVALVVCHQKYGKKGSVCSFEFNKIDCLSNSKDEKYKNPDGGTAEKGSVISNPDNVVELRKSMYGEESETYNKGVQRVKSVQGHENRGYRESFSGSKLPEMQQGSTEDMGEDYGESNEALDADGDGELKVFQDVNTNTKIESGVKENKNGRYELTPIRAKGDVKRNNMINSGEKVAERSPVIETKLPPIGSVRT